MGKPITSAAETNPFNHILGPTERYRLKDGVLTVEQTTNRSNSSAWKRFWTRGQYSQSAILKEMSKLYKAAQKSEQEGNTCHINKTFLENYKTLVTRATTQNIACAKMNAISRFFHAKREINTSKAQSQIDQITADLIQLQQEADLKAQEEAKVAAEAKAKAKAEAILDNSEIKELIKYNIPLTQITEERVADIKDSFQKEIDQPWWDEEEPDNETPVLWTTDNFISEPYMLLAPLGKEAKDGNLRKQLEQLLTALDLDTVEKHKEKHINGPFHLQQYLLTNKDDLVKNLQTLDFVK